MLDLTKVVVNLKGIFDDVAILSINTDIPDDVFDVRIVCGNRKTD